MPTAIDTITGRDLVERLGFLLVPGAPLSAGRAYLIVALRPSPTLEHFDPARAEYWMTSAGRGMPVLLDWATPVAEQSEFAWGLIRVVDRLGVSNEFVSFGGELLVRRYPDVKVAVFSSDAPIVARGGHSQSWELASHEITAFLARVRAACDPHGGFERRASALSPAALYAAFVWDRLATIMAGERRAGWSRADRLILLRERRRLRDSSPSDWAAGVELACELGSTAPIPRPGRQ